MSLASTINRNDYLGNGSTATYNYTFKVFLEEDLKVLIEQPDDTVVTLTLGVDYTVTAVDEVNGSTIVLTNAGQDWIDSNGFLDNGYSITIRRVVSLDQIVDIRNQGPYFPEIHEDEFDKLTMIDQQQQEDIDRSIKFPETVTSDEFDPTLPVSLVGNPGVSFIVNPTGDGFVEGPTADEISDAQASAVAAAASAAASASSASDAADSASDAADSAAAAALVEDDVNDLVNLLIAQTNIHLELMYQDKLGTGNGVTTNFALQRTFNTGSIFVLLSGQLVQSSEYTINAGVTVVFGVAPTLGQDVTVIYLKSSQDDRFTVEALTGTINGVNKTFTYVGSPKSLDSFLVFFNGKFYHKFAYSHNTTTKTIVLDDAPGVGQYMICIYPSDTTQTSTIIQDALGFGDNATVRFGPLSAKPFNKESLYVHLDGIQVDKANYSLTSDRYVAFTTAPAAAQEVGAYSYFVDKIDVDVLEYRALSAAENTSRILRLKVAPALPEQVMLDHQDASFLIYGIDFTITNDNLTLLTTARANDVSAGEYLRIKYKT